MIVLSEVGFHEGVAAHPRFACILHRGPLPAGEGVAMAAHGADADPDPWTWASLDLAAAPAIETMFGVSGPGPHLLVMRDRVVLYSGVLPATQDGRRTLLDRAAGLDMANVRAEIAQERAGRAALFSRRVCPTVWRQR